MKYVELFFVFVGMTACVWIVYGNYWSWLSRKFEKDISRKTLYYCEKCKSEEIHIITGEGMECYECTRCGNYLY